MTTSLEPTGSGAAHFDEGNVYFIGNATTLIRFGGLTILTDPAADSSTTTTQFVYLAHGDTYTFTHPMHMTLAGSASPTQLEQCLSGRAKPGVI